MKLWKVPADELVSIVTNVSDNLYGGNIVFKRFPEKDGRAIAFTLTVRKSAGPAGRRSNEGRKIATCCWHGHRDVMIAIFRDYPDARLKTAVADYRGEKDFEDRFEETGNDNIGSQMVPMCRADACECEG